MHPAHTSETQVVGEADIRRLEAEKAAAKSNETPAPTGTARAKGAAKGDAPSPEAAPAKSPTYSKPATASPEPEEKKT